MKISSAESETFNIKQHTNKIHAACHKVMVRIQLQPNTLFIKEMPMVPRLRQNLPKDNFIHMRGEDNSIHGKSFSQMKITIFTPQQNTKVFFVQMNIYMEYAESAESAHQDIWVQENTIRFCLG